MKVYTNFKDVPKIIILTLAILGTLVVIAIGSPIWIPQMIDDLLAMENDFDTDNKSDVIEFE